MNLTAIEEITKGTTKTTGVSDFMELELSLIYPNPNQPRKIFDEEYIKELASSITANGLIQPIAVVKDGAGKYMIISGECRYKAHILLSLITIKAHVINANSKKIEELTLIENIQRKDLTDFEIAKYIGLLWNSGQYKLKKDLAKAIGKKDTYVSKALSVLKLDDKIITDIQINNLDISISVLDEISRVDDIKLQNNIYTQYKAGEIKRDDIKKVKNKTSPRESFKLHEQFKTTGTILNQCFNDFEFKNNSSYNITIKEL